MHQPTDRVIKVIEYIVAKAQPVSLAEISCDTCIAKTTLLPLLQTLCEREYFVKDSSGKYSAAAALFALANSVKQNFSASELVHSVLENLAQKTGETCYLAVLRGGDVLYVDKADSSQPLRMLAPIGHTFPAYATALGKSLLAGVSVSRLKELYPNGLRPLTAHTLTDFDELALQLGKAEKDGYTLETEESMEHIRCFAVPIKKQGVTKYALSVSIPVFRFCQDNQAQLIAHLKNHAADIGRIIDRDDLLF